MKIIQAHLLSRCQAGGVSWSASSRRGCMSEDMLLETSRLWRRGAPRLLHWRKWGGGGGGGREGGRQGEACVCVCV